MSAAEVVWGASGLISRRDWPDVIVIVDVLSFSTCVDIAASQGATVFPATPAEPAALKHLAAERDAFLAHPRWAAGEDGFSLSPDTMSRLQPGDRLLLPSPNGSRLSTLLGETPGIAACLRNASSIAAHLNAHYGRVLVVAAGEHWPDGSLRPALEDWLGAGAVCAALHADLCPDAHAARAAFLDVRGDIPGVLTTIPSGQELIQSGHPRDVELAAELDVSATIPILRDGGYHRGGNG